MSTNRSLLLGVVFAACVPVKVAPVSPVFPADAVQAAKVDSGSFDRALQRLVSEGFEIVSTTPASGLVIAERTMIDKELTAQKAERWVGGREPPNYARRLTLTLVVGPASATLSPKVVLCRHVRTIVRCNPELLPELEPSEADTIDRLIGAIEGPP